jgi:hypothetical protein
MPAVLPAVVPVLAAASTASPTVASRAAAAARWRDYGVDEHAVNGCLDPLRRNYDVCDNVVVGIICDESRRIVGRDDLRADQLGSRVEIQIGHFERVRCWSMRRRERQRGCDCGCDQHATDL